MNTCTHTPSSTAYVKPINQRGRAWKPDPITNQFRFIERMAFACHERDVPYVLTWGLADGVMSATITVIAAYGTAHDRDSAKRGLEESERAA